MATILSTPTSMTVTASGTSALRTLALSMTSGEWRQLSAGGLGLFTGQGGSSGLLTGYSTKFVRDPLTQKMYYIGCDHGAPDAFVQYDEAANAWSLAASFVPWGINRGTDTDHGYDHIAFDNLHGKLYRRVHARTSVMRWEGGTTWTAIDYSGTVNYTATTAGVTFFPDLGPNGSIVVYQSNGSAPKGIVFGIDPVTLARTTYANGFSPMAELHGFAHYSPQRRCVVFGGGNGSYKIWRLDANGSVSALTDVPGTLTAPGAGYPHTLPVNNPANGNFLFMNTSSRWYELNPTGTGTWTARGGTVSILSSQVFDAASDPAFGTIACPIPEYGVIALVKAYSGSQPAQMWLFKP